MFFVQYAVVIIIGLAGLVGVLTYESSVELGVSIGLIVISILLFGLLVRKYRKRNKKETDDDGCGNWMVLDCPTDCGSSKKDSANSFDCDCFDCGPN